MDKAQKELAQVIEKYFGADAGYLDISCLDLAKRILDEGWEKSEWISVKDRLPEEHDSTFAKFYGTEKWLHGMFRATSNDVNACVEYEDGTRSVNTLRTLDGKWNLKGIGEKKVTHWKPLPQPPKGE